jgi:chemotaxis protein methyltransferase CheR
MEKETFDSLRRIIFDTSGISLGEDKLPLLSARIAKRLRALQLSSEIDYLKFLKEDKEGKELVRFIDVVSTNTTYFYREPEHFTFLTQALSARKNQKEIKIWCAAASSGEEPYTLSITAKEALGNIPCKILATDISMTILERARSGFYSGSQLEHIPQNIQEKYLDFEESGGEVSFSVKPEIRKSILFKRLNLSSFPYPLNGPFDFIFCRNVMIYFDNPLKAKIVAQFERLLAPNGYLVISKTESLMSVPTRLSSIGNSIYRFKDGA